MILNTKNIQIGYDRSVNPSQIDIGMQHENGVTKILFEFGEEFNFTDERLYFIVTDGNISMAYPLVDNAVVIGSEITQKKAYTANFVISKSEIKDSINKNNVMWISNDIRLIVTLNSINVDYIESEVLPVQFQIIYDDLLDLKKDLEDKLSSGYFKGEKGDTGEVGPKGDTGEKGDPGQDYVLTEDDKSEIAGVVKAEVSGDINNLNNKTDELKSDLDYQTSKLSKKLEPVFDDYYVFKSIDISDKIQNGYYDGTTFYSNSNYRCLNYECSEGEKLKISTYLPVAMKNPVVTFYSEDNTRIARYGGWYDGQTEDKYFSDYYVVVPKNSTFFIINGSNISYYPITLKKYVRKENEQQKYRDTSYRYLTHLNMQNGVYDGGTFYPNANYRCIAISCSEGERYLVNCNTYAPAKMSVAQFYNSNNQLISKTTPIEETTVIIDYPITIPTDCTWFVVTSSAHETTDDRDFNVRIYEEGKKPLYRKNYIAIGDSITYINDGWRPWFKRMTGANEVMCTAVSGATLCDYDDTVVNGNPTETAHSNTLSNQVQMIINETPSENVDFIIISAGTNDHADLSEFQGGVTQFADKDTGVYQDIDTVDRTRYDGAMRWIAEKLWSVFPNADIFWCTPIQAAGNVRNTWLQIMKSDYMKEIATYLSCPIIDATRRSGFYGRYEVKDTNSKYLADGLHPNMYGREKLGKYYASEVINYYSYEID